MPSSIFPKLQHRGSAPLYHRARGLGGLLLMAVMVLAAGALGCGGEHEEGCHGEHGGGAERFELGRARMGMFRTDSRTGRVWLMPLNGDGGWIERGAAPDLAGSPGRDGRFEVLSIGPIREPIGRNTRNDNPVLVRFDHATGRTWLLPSEESETWELVRDTQAPPDLQQTPATAEPPAASSPSGPEAAAAEGAARSSRVLAEDTDDAYPILTGDQLGTTPEELQETLQTLRAARTKEGLPRKIRVWSVQQLGEVDPDLAVPELLVVLEDEDPYVVAEAIRQLSRIGRASTIPPILALKGHPDPIVRAAVEESVTRVP